MACFVAQFQMIGPWKYMMLSIMTWWSWSAFRTFMALLSGSTNKGMSKLQHQQLTIFITWGFNSCILSYSMMKTLTFFVSFSIPFLQIHLEPVKVMKLQTLYLTQWYLLMQRGLLNTGGPTILQFPESEYVHLYLAPSWVPDAGSYFKLSSINVSLGNIYFKFCTLAVLYAWFASSTLFSPLPTNISLGNIYFKLSSINVSLGNIYFKFCTLAVLYAWFASSTLFSPLPTNISQSMKFTLQQVFFWKCLWLYSFFYTSNECLLILGFLILMNHLTLFWHSNWPKCWAFRILYYYYPTMFFCILSLTTQGYNFEIFCYVFFMSWWDICCWLYMFVSFFLLLWQIPNSSLVWCLQGEV